MRSGCHSGGVVLCTHLGLDVVVRLVRKGARRAIRIIATTTVMEGPTAAGAEAVPKILALAAVPSGVGVVAVLEIDRDVGGRIGLLRLSTIMSVEARRHPQGAGQPERPNDGEARSPRRATAAVGRRRLPRCRVGDGQGFEHTAGVHGSVPLRVVGCRRRRTSTGRDTSFLVQKIVECQFPARRVSTLRQAQGPSPRPTDPSTRSGSFLPSNVR